MGPNADPVPHSAVSMGLMTLPLALPSPIPNLPILQGPAQVLSRADLHPSSWPLHRSAWDPWWSALPRLGGFPVIKEAPFSDEHCVPVSLRGQGLPGGRTTSSTSCCPLGVHTMSYDLLYPECQDQKDEARVPWGTLCLLQRQTWTVISSPPQAVFFPTCICFYRNLK